VAYNKHNFTIDLRVIMNRNISESIGILQTKTGYCAERTVMPIAKGPDRPVRKNKGQRLFPDHTKFTLLNQSGVRKYMCICIAKG
jgi:hypothetical protein